MIFLKIRSIVRDRRYSSNICAKRLRMSNCLFFKKMIGIWKKTREGANNFCSVKVQECNLYSKILLTPRWKAIMRIFLFPTTLQAFVAGNNNINSFTDY